jgi:hypothetical protein
VTKFLQRRKSDMALKLTDSQVTDLAKPLAGMLDTIAKFYENPEVKKGFEEWHLKKFGCKPNEVRA